jgi:prepilin-type N-terminal cleavage/methylation domain-containing protein
MMKRDEFVFHFDSLAGRDPEQVAMSRAVPAVSGSKALQAGFTLIELMITVAIVAILAAVAMPAYTDYVIRGRLVEGTNALSALRAQMEQYYQDNRTYKDVGTFQSPCNGNKLPAFKYFNVTCTDLDKTTYTLVASGTGMTAGATYTVNQQNTMITTGLPSAWGAAPSKNQCWIMRRGETC